MWVRFLADFNFTPKEDSRVSVQYLQGMARNVRRQCGEAAIAAGKAEPCAADEVDRITCDEGRYFFRGWKRCGVFGGGVACHPFGCTNAGPKP